MKNNEKFYRRSLRLQGYDYSQAGAYFITICTNHRRCLFGAINENEVILNDLGKIVLDVWYSLPARYPDIELDEFVIMPNHIHGIILITVGSIHELPVQKERRNMLLPKVVGYFKMNSAKYINQKTLSAGTFLWQRNYYEHIIRNEAELNRIQKYIISNPAKWVLDHDNPQGKPDKEEINFWQDFGLNNL